MKVNAHNYQAFILDYFEGTLSAQEREELLSFLNAHPDFRKEFEEFENISLNDFTDDETFFSEKLKIELKKETSLSDEQLFDYSEGNLSAEEKIAADKILNGNTALQQELKLWQASRVSSDVKADKLFKERLKKRRAVVIPLWSNVYLRAAAVIALLLGAGWIYFTNEPASAEGFAFAEVKNHTRFVRNAQTDSNPLVIPVKENTTVPQNSFVHQRNNKKIIAPQPNIVVNKDSTASVIVNNNTVVPLKKDSVALAGTNNIKNKIDSAYSVTAIKNAVDSLNNSNNKIVRGTWKPAETIPTEKKGFKKKLLDAAVTCLRGLHVIGVKKANAVKQVNPDNGSANYILVLGDKSYSTYR